MMPPDDLFSPDGLDLMLRYVKGDVTPVERTRIERAMAADPTLSERVIAARSARWDSTQQLERTWAAIGTGATRTTSIADQPFAAHHASSDATIRRSRMRVPSQSGRLFMRSIVVAGGVAAAAVGAFVFLRGAHGTQALQNAQTYATSAEQQANVTLLDGTQVTLGPRTRVRAYVSNDTRTVTVDGEAYFSVARTSDAPFIVRSGLATTRVLGTAFLVRHYANDRTARIMVDEGKVSVESHAGGSTAVTLTAGHVGEVTDSIIHVLDVNDGIAATSWMNGKLVFRNTPLSDVLAALRRWYGYEFRVADPALMQRHVTLGMTTHSSAAALANLEQLLGVNVSVVGDTVTLVPHATPSSPATKRLNYDSWTPTKEAGR